MLQRAQCGVVVAGCILLAGSVPVGSAPASPTVERIAPPFPAIAFGGAVTGLDDVDGDGVADVAVGAPGSGHAAVLSGSTRTVLHQWADRPGADSYFGWAVAGPGDLDGDGVPEVVVGAPSKALTVRGACPRSGLCPVASAGAGRAVVFSGASGGVLRELAPSAAARPSFGASLTGAGDLSGDQVPDVVVGAPAWGQGPGVVFALSGADGAQLWSRVEPPEQLVPGAAFGEAVVATPDVSGDGIADLLVPAPSPAFGEGTGRVHLVSGADGAVVRTISDPVAHAGDAFGGCVASVGDQDGDGVADQLIGEPGAGQLHIYSGGGRGLLRSVPLPVPVAASSAPSSVPSAAAPRAGECALAPVADKDGDGLGDVWVGVPSARSASLVNATGALLATTSGPSAEGAFGASAAAVGTWAATRGATR